METNELINNFVDQVIAGDNSQAKQSFEDMISYRVSDALEQRKIDLAQRIFNQGQETTEEESSEEEAQQ